MQLQFLILAIKLFVIHFGNTVSIGIAAQSKRLRRSGFVLPNTCCCRHPGIVKQRMHKLKREEDFASKNNYLFCSLFSTYDSVLSCPPYDQRQRIKRDRQIIRFIPEPYNSLQIGEVYRPVPDLAHSLTVERLAWSPDIFLVRQFLPLESERKSLIEEASQCKFTVAETTFGPSSKRRGSNVWWINDEPSLYHQHCYSKKFVPSGRNVAHYMSNLSAHLFLPLTSASPEDVTIRQLIVNEIKKERLQLVKYNPGGAFDLHHDGQNRFVTVLTYLNGVAGTWFPFAQSARNPTTTAEGNDCMIRVEDKLILRNGETPGRDGLLIVGSEHGSQLYAPQRGNQEVMREGGDCSHCLLEGVNGRCSAGTTSNDNSSAVVHIQPGDAVIFFNYDFHFQGKKGDVLTSVPNWRAIHAALPTQKEKWIATNWFSFHSEAEES
jgi:hypothetical protein